MAGYTRQSATDIVNGQDITAPPLAAEFNKLQTAFDGSSGHEHTGATGDAPKIALGTSVSGYLPAENGGTGGKNNLSATTNPTVGDDAVDGYAPGSIWENVNTGRVFICVGNTAGAAVWREFVAYNETVNAIVPETNDEMDLGTASNRFQDVFLSGGVAAQGNSTFSGNVTVSGTISGNTTGYHTGNVSGNLTGNMDGDLEGTVTDTKNLAPKTDANYNIGTSSNPYDNVYANTFVGNVTGNITSAGTSTFGVMKAGDLQVTNDGYGVEGTVSSGWLQFTTRGDGEPVTQTGNVYFDVEDGAAVMFGDTGTYTGYVKPYNATNYDIFHIGGAPSNQTALGNKSSAQDNPLSSQSGPAITLVNEALGYTTDSVVVHGDLLDVNAPMTVAGNITLQAGSGIDGDLIKSFALAKNINPTSNNTYKLGQSDDYWSQIHTGRLYAYDGLYGNTSNSNYPLGYLTINNPDIFYKKGTTNTLRMNTDMTTNIGSTIDFYKPVGTDTDATTKVMRMKADGTVEFPHASGIDVSYVVKTDDIITGGITYYDIQTAGINSGELRLTDSGGEKNFRKLTNNTSSGFEIQVPTFLSGTNASHENVIIHVEITNGVSAGAVTFNSGYDRVIGAADLTTTEGDKFLIRITSINGSSLAEVIALQ